MTAAPAHVPSRSQASQALASLRSREVLGVSSRIRRLRDLDLRSIGASPRMLGLLAALPSVIAMPVVLLTWPTWPDSISRNDAPPAFVASLWSASVKLSGTAALAACSFIGAAAGGLRDAVGRGAKLGSIAALVWWTTVPVLIFTHRRYFSAGGEDFGSIIVVLALVVVPLAAAAGGGLTSAALFGLARLFRSRRS